MPVKYSGRTVNTIKHNILIQYAYMIRTFVILYEVIISMSFIIKIGYTVPVFFFNETLEKFMSEQ